MTRNATIAVVAAIWVLSCAPVFAQGPPPGAGRPVALEGELDVLYEDAEQEGRLRYFLQSDARRFPLRFQGNGPDLLSGSRVRVAGNLADDGTLTTTTVTTLDLSTTRTLGEQRVLVILFNFSNNTAQPYTTLAADSVNAQVRDFYLENSYQQTIMSFTVTGWHTISATNATCDYYTWADQADAAAVKAGFTIAAYDRRVYAFPQTSACAWTGMGNVGGPRSWVNGGYKTRVVAHEQGHNFGNRHSHARKCDSTGCRDVDYGDDRDVLGAGGVVGHLNAFQKERLGWLNYGSSPIVQTVSTSNDYWIDNYSTPGGNTKGLKIWNPATGAYYYLEARERVGFDANVPPGVTLHTGVPSSSDSSYQTDLDPLTTTWDSTLDVGQAVADKNLGVTIATLSSGIDGALVRVTFNSSTCVTAAPAVSLSPSSQTGSAGATLQYTVTVTNKNGSGCAASLFTLSGAVPSGWSSSFTPASSASLAPGASASMTWSVTSPSTASGSYSINVKATDGTSGLAATAAGTASVTASLTNLSATVSAVPSGNGNNRGVTITVGVKNGSVAVAGASVAITVTTPLGATTKLSATTDSSGTAVVKYTSKPKDPSGTYKVAVTATAGSGTATASTTFTMP